MEDRETARMRKYGESKTTRIMMATVPHVTSGLGVRKFQADGFLLTGVYKSAVTDDDDNDHDHHHHRIKIQFWIQKLRKLNHNRYQHFSTSRCIEYRCLIYAPGKMLVTQAR